MSTKDKDLRDFVDEELDNYNEGWHDERKSLDRKDRLLLDGIQKYIDYKLESLVIGPRANPKDED